MQWRHLETTQNVAQVIQNVAQAIQNATRGHTECCTDHTECFTGYTECVITALSCNACTNFISCAVLCWARGSRYVAEPAHFNSWAPRGVKSIGPATQSTIYFSNGISLNDIRGGIKCCTCQSKRASSLSDHFHLTIPWVHKMQHLPIKTSLIVKWRAPLVMNKRIYSSKIVST